MNDKTLTTLKLAHPADFPAIAELIAQQNQSPDRRCLHSHEGSAANVLKTMENWLAEDSILFATAVDSGGQLIGAIGCEYDVAIARGWLWGPFVQVREKMPTQWMQMATELYPVLDNGLPFKPAQLDALIEEPFQWGREFYEQIGYSYTKSAYVYVAPRVDSPRAIAYPAMPLAQHHAASFSALFDRIFPKTFIHGDAIVERILGQAAHNELEQVFVVTDDDSTTGEVLGFNYAKVNDSASEGYIEFIGVSPEARRQGVGKRVLLTGMNWLFHAQGMPQIGLTTDEDNAGAQRLYEQAGFRLDHTGLNYRKTFAEQPPE